MQKHAKTHAFSETQPLMCIIDQYSAGKETDRQTQRHTQIDTAPVRHAETPNESNDRTHDQPQTQTDTHTGRQTERHTHACSQEDTLTHARNTNIDNPPPRTQS